MLAVRQLFHSSSMKSLPQIILALLIASFCLEAIGESPITRDFPPGLQVPAAARPGPGFDVDKATEAWLGLLSPEQRALSDQYFEGGYWLELWEPLYTIGVMLLLLVTGLSRRMRELAERASRRPIINVAIFATLFVATTFLLGLPLQIYIGFVREHEYGLSNLSFVGWLGEALIGLAVSIAIDAVALSLLYAAVRRAGARWWIWATGLTFVLNLFLTLITPVFIAPLFNDYKPLAPGPARDAVASLARANEIPTEHLEWFDASKQTTRISANVSGLWGVTRINLNDNLLNKTSLPEIKAVLGHEMGHYVLNHGFQLAIYLTLVLAIVYIVLHFAFDRALARWSARWGLRDRADPAALPLALVIFTVIWLVLLPLRNTVIRDVEAEADAYGLNAAREPEGFAMAAMRLSTYRKLVPGSVEEFIFYDHPSGYDRVRRAMVWRKENMLVEPVAP
jgi:STE24 endopeptidase